MILISITQRKSDSDCSLEKQKPNVGVYCYITKGDADATDEKLVAYAMEFKGGT